MIKLATSSYEWRRRSWVTVARECGAIASRPTIEKAFKEAGYGRYSPRQKALSYCDHENEAFRLVRRGWSELTFPARRG